MENINFNRVHFVGIGGIGMSGIAEIMLDLGYQISGSDTKESDVTRRLASKGAVIFIGQNADNITSNIDLVVRSTAIRDQNPEIVKAMALEIPIIHRADMLSFLMLDKKAICIAGSHGKTTTSSMIALMLELNQMDPTIIVGGEISQLGSNARLGNSDLIVAEADESDRSFLKLSPWMSIITNIEEDHLDHYIDLDEIRDVFAQFISKSGEKGVGIFCSDCSEVLKIMDFAKGEKITYGFNDEAVYQARNWRHDNLNCADVYEKGQFLGEIVLNVPGKHNISNALAAVAVGRYLGLSFEKIAKSLLVFTGAKRRFQLIGEVNGIKVIDDYAHHPTEIKVTLEAARSGHKGRIVVAFQPHRYSRTKFLAKDFASSLLSADKIFLTEVYSAGEELNEGAESGIILDYLPEDKGVVLLERCKLTDALAKEVKSGDMVLILGAGSIWQNAQELVDRLQNQK